MLRPAAAAMGRKTLADLLAATRNWWRRRRVTRIVSVDAPARVALPPDLQRGREPRGDRPGDDGAARGGRSRRLAPAGGRRRLPGRHRASSPTAWPRSSPGVEVLHRTGKEGLGPAYLAGFEYALDARRRVVIVMDADFSHDPQPPARDDRRRPGAATSCSARATSPAGEITNWPRLRRVLSRSGSLYARLMLGVKVRDLTTGFRCVRRRVLETRRALDAALAGLRLQHRADLPRAAGRLQRRGDPDPLPRSRGGREQDVAADRDRGAAARAEAARAAHRGRRAALQRRRAQPPRALALAALAAAPRGHPRRAGRRLRRASPTRSPDEHAGRQPAARRCSAHANQGLSSQQPRLGVRLGARACGSATTQARNQACRLSGSASVARSATACASSRAPDGGQQLALADQRRSDRG